MTEPILFRTELDRPLTYVEIDNNFKYVANPWSPTREIYSTGMIVYHDVVSGKYILYRANKTTTEGYFDLSEWDAINNNIVKVVISTESTLSNYIVDEWAIDSISIGDYLVTSTGTVYLLYQNDGDSIADYIGLTIGDGTSIANVVLSAYSTMANYIVNEWDGTIELGDFVILSDSNVWMLTTGNGSLITQYVLLSSSTINWVDIIGKPNSSASQIDTAVANSHEQGTDQYLDFGGTNQITATSLYSHVNDSSIHFSMGSISIDHTANILNVGTYIHTQIDTHIDDTTIHLTAGSIDHALLLNSGTYTHVQIDAHLTGAVLTHVEIDTHVSSGFYEHYQIDTHIDDISIHFSEINIDHNNITNRGSFTHLLIDDHINDISIHTSPSNIDHTTISNIGNYSHVQIDTHIDNSNIHFVVADIDHSLLIDSGFYTHYQIDSHVNDLSIHYLEEEINHDNLINVGYYTHGEIDTHMENGNYHYLQIEINHGNLLNTGVYGHAYIDNHIDNTAIHLTENLISHLNIANIGSNSHVDIDDHINDASIHWSNATLDHDLLLNIGVNSHSQIDNHMLDMTTHYFQTDIDHGNLQNGGLNSHSQIDTHINNSNIHFQIGEIVHDDLSNSGFYNHYEIDSHIEDSSIHFGLDDIDHNNIDSIGVYSHTQIDTFIDGIETAMQIYLPLRRSLTATYAIELLDNNNANGDRSFVLGNGNTSDAIESAIIGGNGNVLEISASRSVIF